jgi:metal-dependent amidase/aminoacylase/carboxypeptidase family protein
MGTEEFSFFAQKAPGFHVRPGVAPIDKHLIAGVPTAAFDVDESCLKTGLASMIGLVCDALDGVIAF